MRNQKNVVYLYNKIKQIEIMTTAEFLTANRETIIRVIKTKISSRSAFTLKDAMVVFMNKMEETNNNTTLSYGAVKEASNNNFQTGETSVSFSKPYSESNHAKQVAYFGADKVKSFKNNL